MYSDDEFFDPVIVRLRERHIWEVTLLSIFGPSLLLASLTFFDRVVHGVLFGVGAGQFASAFVALMLAFVMAFVGVFIGVVLIPVHRACLVHKSLHKAFIVVYLPAGAVGTAMIMFDWPWFMWLPAVTLAISLLNILCWRYVPNDPRLSLPMRCPECGFDIRTHPATGCPECGWGREQ